MLKFINFTTHRASPALTEIGVQDIPADINSALRHILTFSEVPSESEILIRSSQAANLASVISNLFDNKNFLIYGKVFFIPSLAKAIAEKGLVPYSIILQKNTFFADGKVKISHVQKGVVRCFP